MLVVWTRPASLRKERRRKGRIKETKFLLAYTISGFPLPSITLDLPLEQESVYTQISPETSRLN